MLSDSVSMSKSSAFSIENLIKDSPPSRCQPPQVTSSAYYQPGFQTTGHQASSTPTPSGGTWTGLPGHQDHTTALSALSPVLAGFPSQGSVKRSYDQMLGCDQTSSFSSQASSVTDPGSASPVSWQDNTSDKENLHPENSTDQDSRASTPSQSKLILHYIEKLLKMTDAFLNLAKWFQMTCFQSCHNRDK